MDRELAEPQRKPYLCVALSHSSTQTLAHFNDMKRLFSIFIGCALSTLGLQAAKVEIQHVHPLHWWVGMSQPELQIMIHGKNIAQYQPQLQAQGVKLLRTERTPNPNYLFLYVDTREAQPQTFHIQLKTGNKVQHTIPYQLEARTTLSRKAFDASDVVYLLMPDRFSDGNTKLNNVPRLKEAKVDLANPDGRHGGDIAGLRSKLPYLQDLGITAIWPTPMLINDQPSHTYHGYAITDYYQIDPRIGSNAEFKSLVADCHQHGIKMIMDWVFNHCGDENFLFRDRPADDWFNFDSKYTQTNYRLATLTDPHAAQRERLLAQDGWFVKSMPDLNQRNPAVLTYLIQASIWWTEYADIDGIRQDTYPYADFEAMAQWNKRMDQEYPGFNIVGETWINNNVSVSYWQKDSKLAAPRNSHLKTVMDFPLMYAIHQALSEESDDWDKGLARIYNYLSQDFVYADPNHLLTFLDNHDTERFSSNPEQAKDFCRYQQALTLLLTLLLTLRGIPQLYYGDEIGMAANRSKGDGAMRENFPGGFSNATHNAFTPEGRTSQEQEYFQFTRQLLHWRKGNSALSFGKLTQFAPQNGVYVYARSASDHHVVVIMNGTTKERELSLEHYAEVFPKNSAFDVFSQQQISWNKTLHLEPRGIMILDFSK